MRTIEVLDRTTIDKIAAGEVVERPASVVKELVENAIDADSTAITVEIRDGGIGLIRITDNGCGIPSDQVKKAFLRHATSKIRKVEDLTLIASLGFRGEALSSISAVAQVELITKTPEALTGIRYCIDGGVEKEFEEVGAPSGSTFLIRNLFFNVPARAKFLKSAMTEGNHVTQVVEQLALSHPDISFKYIMNGQSRLYTSGNGNLQEIIYQVYGRDIAKELVPFQSESESVTVTGFIGKPVIARGNRNFENYFVNGRYVRSKLLAKAIEDGYHGFMMQHRYPFTLLYLEINGEKVDVNVHPSKMELRFSDQESLYHQICQGIKNALMYRERIPDVTFGKPEKNTKESTPQGGQNAKVQRVLPPEPFERNRRSLETLPEKQSAPSAKRDGSSAAEKSIPFSIEKTLPVSSVPVYPSDPSPEEKLLVRESAEYTVKKQETVQPHEEKKEAVESPVRTQEAVQTPEIKHEAAGNPVKEQLPEQDIQEASVTTGEQMQLFDDILLSEKARKRHRIIGQIFDTYWLVEYDGSLYIIDQHAAHERVMYERLVKAYENRTVNSQLVCPPAVVSLTAQEVVLLEKYKDVFASMGFETEYFGGKEYKICAVPADCYRVSADQLFRDIMDQLGQLGDHRPESISERLASMACKAAVKGNSYLSEAEAEALIDELLTLENPYNCPHGRPTIISMSRYELEKKFKRIL